MLGVVSADLPDGPDASRFCGPATRNLHARGVSSVQYYDRSVAVGIVRMPTGSAGKVRLALATLPVDCPAGRAGLRRISWVDLCEASGFVKQHRFDLVPASVQYNSVQSSLLRDVVAGSINGSLGGTRHIFRSKPLQNYAAIIPANLSSGFVRPMFANAGHLSRKPSNPKNRFMPTGRAALTPRSNAMGLFCLVFNRIEVRGQPISGSVRQHYRNAHPAIYANCEAVVLQRGFLFTANTDLPSYGRERNSGFTYGADHISREAQLYPTNFWESYATPFAIESFNSDFSPGKREALIFSLLFGLRETRVSFPCTLKSIFKGFKHSLLRGAWHRANKIEFRADSGQFSALRNIIEIISGSILEPAPMLAALFKRQIPNQTAHTSKLRENSDLLSGRLKHVCVAEKSHIKLIALALITVKGDR